MARGARDEDRGDLPGGDPPRRVLLGLNEVAGYYAGLLKGFEDLGVPVTLLNLASHPFGYPEGHNSRATRAARWLAARELAARGIARHALRAARVAVQAVLLSWALPRHDLFIFSHGATFLGQRDLWLLKLCRKQIICAYHGNDSRAPYLTSYWGLEVTPTEARRRISLSQTMKRRVRRAERHADALVNIPSQGHFHERPYVLGLYMGLPTVAAALDSAPPPERPPDAGVVCLHAPSNPAAKGTKEIRRIVARLRERGLPVTLREIQGVPNHVLLEEIRQCDVVFDQLYADYASPGLATEAAWLGKPVLIGGYGVDVWLELMPADRLPATWYVRPEDAEDALAELVLNADRRRELGLRARTFVERHWRPSQVATRFLQLAAGEIDERWYVDPAHHAAVYACFLPEESARAMVLEVLRAGGREALQLANNSEVERKVVEFAGWESEAA